MNMGRSFWTVSGVLVAVLFFRVSSGFDHTDEMQYYGQLIGLLEQGRLFSNDLFVQQTVWLPLYPVFWLYYFFLGEAYLIVFARAFMALMIFGLFVFAVNRFRKLEFDMALASLTAFCLTFAVTHHNIFAVSYNTLSQFLWIGFLLHYLDWRPDQKSALENYFVPAALSFLAAFAYPPSAVIMAFLIIIRHLAERRWHIIPPLLAVYAICIFAGGGLALWFATPDAFLRALTFSQGYGVGGAIFSHRDVLMTFSMLIFFLFASMFVPKHRFADLYIYFAFAMLVALGWRVVSGDVRSLGATASIILQAMACGAFSAYLGAIGENRQARWLVVSLIAASIGFVLTSSNGFAAMYASVGLVLPFLMLLGLHHFGLRLGFGKSGFAKISALPPILLSFILLLSWSAHPYRSLPWYQHTQAVAGIAPIFAGLRADPQTLEFFGFAQNTFKQVSDKKVLIAGRYPSLYFALNVQPTTCMFYMHSIGSPQSADALTGCLRDKPMPEYVLLISHDEKDPFYPNLRTMLSGALGLKPSNCVEFRHENTGFYGSIPYARTDIYNLCQTFDAAGRPN